MKIDGEQIKKKFRKTWENVVYRCTNPISTGYQYYSIRGISKDWMAFRNFETDMLQSFVMHVGEYGLKNTTIDRIDNQKGYSKENCRWATWEVQRENSKRRLLKEVNYICPECKKKGTTKTSKTFCSAKCSNLYKMYTPEQKVEARKKKNARLRYRYHNEQTFRLKRMSSQMKYQSRKALKDKEYVSRLKEYRRKYRKLHPVKYSELPESRKEKIRKKNMDYYYKNRAFILKKVKEKYNKQNA